MEWMPQVIGQGCMMRDPGGLQQLLMRDLLNRAVQMRDRGDLASALRFCGEFIAGSPRDGRGYFVRASINESMGNIDDAIADLERLVGLAPGNAGPDTHLRRLKLIRSIGQVRVPRSRSPQRPLLTMRALGSAGRFGNQIIQYAVARAMAEANGAELAVPYWNGRHFFDLDDPLVDVGLPTVAETDIDFGAMFSGRGRTNIDVDGYFQHEVARLAGRRGDVRDWFRPAASIAGRLDDALSVVRSRGRTVVALHLRNGDFGYGPFWIAPSQWYLDWLAAVWPDLTDPVLYIATDNPADAAEDFAAYAPVMLSDLGVAIDGADHVVDHHVLRNADMLAVSNSSFSISAALLNPRSTQFVRPHPDERRLAPFDPWESAALLVPVDPEPLLSPAILRFLSTTVRRGDALFSLGDYCRPSTNWLRRALPTVLVHEAPLARGLDWGLARKGLAQVRLVTVAGSRVADALAKGGATSLGKGCVDTILVESGEPPSAALIEQMGAWNYRLHELRSDATVPLEGEPGDAPHLWVRGDVKLP